LRVAEVTEFGAPDVLRPAERPDPEPGPGEVLSTGARVVGMIPFVQIGGRVGALRGKVVLVPGGP
jgi:NADPH2:quinone reductase